MPSIECASPEVPADATQVVRLRGAPPVTSSHASQDVVSRRDRCQDNASARLETGRPSGRWPHTGLVTPSGPISLTTRRYRLREDPGSNSRCSIISREIAEYCGLPMH
jgi:hypothetical protein